MQEFTGDLFATKGLEYVLVIGYLALLVICWRFVRPQRARDAADSEASAASGPLARLEADYLFHQGHSWARRVSERVMRVGMDDFAAQLLGTVNGFVLPKVGDRLEEGEPGWEVDIGGRRIPVLSPVTGEVVALNEELLRSPETLGQEPYHGGWVLEVGVRNPAAARRNLLAGALAYAWREEAMDRIQELAERSDAGLSRDGDGVSANGLARTLAPEAWDQVARAFLLADGAPTNGASPHVVPGAEQGGGAEEEREVQTV